MRFTVLSWLSIWQMGAVVVILVVTFPHTASAQDDPHIGVWKLNPTKSVPTIIGSAVQTVIRKYEVFEGDGIKATVQTIGVDGQRTTSTYSAHLDGKDYSYLYAGPSKFDAITLKRRDRWTWVADNKKAGKSVLTGTNVVSKDGKTLTWTYQGTNMAGLPISGVEVYDRQ